MPSLVQRGDVYYAQYFDSSKTPKRRRFSLHTKRRREAERELARLEDEGFDPWSTAPPEKPEPADTLGEAVDAYMASCNHLSKHTVRTYRSIFHLFREHLGLSYQVSEISPADVLAFLDSTSAKAVTRKKYVNHLGYLFRYLEKRGAMERDISKDVKLPRVPDAPPKAMTESEVERMCQAIRDWVEEMKDDPRSPDYRWMADLIRANVHLGLRLGEVVHARWDWVDLERGTLTVQSTDEFTTKRGTMRTIPLSKRARAILSGMDQSTKYIWMHRGRKLKLHWTSMTFARFRDKAGITSGITFHSMRHAFGTWLAERGVPINVIAEMMGHHSVTVTERYARCRPATAMHWINVSFG
jgi:integrase